MKIKNIRVSILMLMSFAFTIIGIGIFNIQNNFVYAATTQDAYCLIQDDGSITQNVTSVGTISGYGEIVMGQPASLSAKANSGFCFAGWLIKYDEQEKPDTYISTNYTDFKIYDSDNVEINLTIVYTDTDYDGVVDSSSLNIEKVFENLTIEPVFDYIYYNVDITSFESIISKQSENIEGNDIYFKEYNSTENIYKNAYFKRSNKSFYLGDVKKVGTPGNEEYYVVHKVGANENLIELSKSLSRGVFKLLENVDIIYSVDVAADLSSNVVDIQNFALRSTSQNVFFSNEGQNTFELNVDSTYGNTTAFNLNFNILQDRTQTNTIIANYHNLFKVDFNVLVDGSAPADYIVKHYTDVEIGNQVYADLYERDGEYFVEIINQGKVYKHIVNPEVSVLGSYTEENRNDKDLITSYFNSNGIEFKKINNTSYLIKSKQDAGVAFDMNIASNVSEDIDGTTFYYYSLDDTTSLDLSFENINSNRVVDVNFISTTYEIRYNFALVSNGEVVVSQTDLVLPNNLYLHRGESINLVLADAPSYVGYAFKGYTLANNLSNSLVYKVNYLNPNGRNVYLCYEKIEYTLKLTNYNQISLGEVGNTYYPINQITINYVKNGANGAYRLLGSSLVDPVWEFATKFTIGDEVSFAVVENTGFNIPGFKFQLLDEETINQFAIDSDFITLHVNADKEIILNVIEEYVLYTITYYIEPTANQLSEEIIMAKISAEADAATITKYNLDDEDITTIDPSDPDYDAKTEVVKIVVSNLKYGNTVSLFSNGKQLPSSEQFYAFNFFTEDGKTQLKIENPTVELDGSIKYCHIETILRNKNIKVMYSMPTSRVNIFVSSDQAFDYEQTNFGVTQNGIEKEFELFQGVLSCEVDVGKTIELTINKSNIHFGYVFQNFTLMEGVSSVEGTTTNGDLTIKFTFVSGEGIQNLTINFEKVKYHFVIKEYGAGKNGESVIDGLNPYFELDVENRTIEFEKPALGYYVGTASFVSNVEDSGIAISSMAESNSSRNDLNNNIYSFTFEYQSFVNIVSYFANQTVGNEIVEIVIRFDYSMYSYNIMVAYGLTNSKGNALDNRVNFPSITLSYDLTTIQGLLSGTNLIFVGVPYGADVRLNVADTVASGFSVYGWTYLNGIKIEDEFDNGSTFLNLNNVSKDYSFAYKLTYTAYTILIPTDPNKGSPNVYINDRKIVDLTNIQITQFDSLKIEANANRVNGYKFKQLTYRGRAESWDETTSSYIAVYEDVIVTEHDFVVESFDVANYYVTDKLEIVFNYEFDLLQIKISNITQDYSDARYSGSLRAGRIENYAISIPLEEYASYEIWATNSISGERRIITETDEITINDIVEVTITINKQAIDSLTNKMYDLTNGLSLYEVKVASLTHGWTQLSAGVYYLRFYLRELADGDYIINKVPTSNMLNINYGYIVLNKTLTVTTNINSVEFYKNIGMSINQVAYGFGSGIPASSQNSSVSSTMQFLAVGGVGYNLLAFEPYFKITSMSVKVGNNKIPTDYFKDYGITIYTVNSDGQTVERTRDNDVISLIEVRYLNNLDIVLELQPIIYFGGYEVTSESKVFDLVFDCDSNGIAKVQKLTMGADRTNYDIAAYSGILNNMSLTYKNARNEIVEGVTNVGIYSVAIEFENTEAYDWLSQLSLPYQIYINVLAKDVYVASVSNVDVVEKIYDGQQTTNKVNILKYLLIKDNLGLEINYVASNANNGFSIKDGYSITQTREVNGVQVPNKNASEGLYNLFVENLSFTNNEFNKNFNLKNTELVIENCLKINKREIKITGIDVYDKIYDGTISAEITETSIPSITNKISGDVVMIDVTKISVQFNTSVVGGDKVVTINFDNAISGEDAANYSFSNTTLSNKKIYPNEISTKIKGIGEIKLINQVGLTDRTKVNLIPIGAKLDVEIIKADTAAYADIYSVIGKYLSNTNAFAVGYKLGLTVAGTQEKISNELLLSIPKVDDLTNIIFLTGDRTGLVKYENKDDNILVSLNSFEEDVDTIIATQRRNLLQLWQIILIAIAVAALIATIIIVFIVIRKKKQKEYSINEKI